MQSPPLCCDCKFMLAVALESCLYKSMLITLINEQKEKTCFEKSLIKTGS